MADIITPEAVDTLYPFPLERHKFEGGENEFLCRECGRPRALHWVYHFIPKPDPEHLFKKPYTRFKGGHPRWRVGRLSKAEADEQGGVSDRRKKVVAGIRAEEAARLAKLMERLAS